ncbi:hypothetical protein F01_570102 [Burkholderia cenocepacia]|nr:hypothetical protein F01_570102 [Burkholderia cenocepacia]
MFNEGVENFQHPVTVGNVVCWSTDRRWSGWEDKTVVSRCALQNMLFCNATHDLMQCNTGDVGRN